MKTSESKYKANIDGDTPATQDSLTEEAMSQLNAPTKNCSAKRPTKSVPISLNAIHN
jgi:hypothetical protein